MNIKKKEFVTFVLEILTGALSLIITLAKQAYQKFST